MNTCKCGCGAQCGGNFRPGHDARWVSQMVKSVVEQRLEELEALGRINSVSPRLGAKFGKALAARRIAVRKAAEPRAARKSRNENLDGATVDRLQAMLDARYWTGQEGTHKPSGKPARVRHWLPADDGVKEHAKLVLDVEGFGSVYDVPFADFVKREYAV